MRKVLRAGLAVKATCIHDHYAVTELIISYRHIGTVVPVHHGIEQQLSYGFLRIVDHLLFTEGSDRYRPSRYHRVLSEGIEFGQHIEETCTECALIEYIGSLVGAGKLNVLNVGSRYESLWADTKEYDSCISRAMILHVIETDGCHLFFQAAMILDQHICIHGLRRIAVAHHVYVEITEFSSQTRCHIECCHIGGAPFCQYSFFIF